jgi:hypothetical protein
MKASFIFAVEQYEASGTDVTVPKVMRRRDACRSQRPPMVNVVDLSVQTPTLKRTDIVAKRLPGLEEKIDRVLSHCVSQTRRSDSQVRARVTSSVHLRAPPSPFIRLTSSSCNTLPPCRPGCGGSFPS